MSKMSKRKRKTEWDFTETLSNDDWRLFLARGELIDAGFAHIKLMTFQNASPKRTRDLRVAFFAGAVHVWATVRMVLAEDTEPTKADYEKLIDQELNAFADELINGRGL